MLLNEDYPHPVPTRAWLRWRENWLFFLLDPEHDVFVTAHMSLQPTFGIARYAFNLIIDGQRISFAEEVPHPENISQSRVVKLGRMQVEFLEPQRKIRISFDGEAHDVDLTLEAALPLFDYAACIDSNPDDYPLAESTSLGFGVFRHQNQTMRGTATLTFKDGNPARSLSGIGYRDHSWGMRDDTMTNEHLWAWAVFPSSTVHVTRVVTRIRPELWVSEGYVGTSAGNLVLGKCEADYQDASEDGLPATVEMRGKTPDGNVISVRCDLANALARNRFLSQRPGENGYLMKHTFCRAVRLDTGESGIAMVEIGAIEKAADAQLSQG